MLGINSRPGDDQAGRGHDHRPGLRRGLGRAAAAAPPDRQDGGRRRLRARRPGGRPAARPAPGHTVAVLRAGRPDRRPAALRHPRVQDGEAPPGPPAGADGGRGHPVPRRASSVGVDVTGGRAAAPLRRGRARRRRHRRARPAGPGPRARRHPPGDGVPAAGQPGRRRATVEPPPIDANGKHVVIIGGGDTGADCLGTALRQGAALGDPARDHAAPPAGAAGLAAVADVPDDLPGVQRARGGRRAAVRRQHQALHRRRRAAAVRRAAPVEVELVGRPVRRGRRAREREIPADLVLLAMGFVGPERGGLLDQLGVELDARGNVARGRRLRHRRARRLRRRGRRPRAVAHRLGDRRGPVLRGCRGPVA